MRRFDHREFADTAALVRAKRGERISVCIPTLDEAATIGAIVTTVKRELMNEAPLVDELMVIDSGSSDGTRDVAARAGANVLLSSDIAPEHGSIRGKGENLWKALHAASGSILCYLDGDIANFHSGFVRGLIGPLLTEPDIGYVKAYYERPPADGGRHATHGGGRISEILVRPLISLFLPELAPVLQPLSGEYAARRSLLESLPFPTGYGVEIAHLIDLARAGKLDAIAQTDLVRRIHHHRDDSELGDAAFAILQVVLRRLARDGILTPHHPLPTLHRRWQIDSQGASESVRDIPEPERPPMSKDNSQFVIGDW
jgi:glucosyl-3-phosphoglycerate synthase